MKMLSIFQQLRKTLDCKEYRLDFDHRRKLTFKTVSPAMRKAVNELIAYLADYPSGNLTVYANKGTSELVIELIRFEP